MDAPLDFLLYGNERICFRAPADAIKVNVYKISSHMFTSNIASWKRNYVGNFY